MKHIDNEATDGLKEAYPIRRHFSSGMGIDSDGATLSLTDVRMMMLLSAGRTTMPVI